MNTAPMLFLGYSLYSFDLQPYQMPPPPSYDQDDVIVIPPSPHLLSTLPSPPPSSLLTRMLAVIFLKNHPTVSIASRLSLGKQHLPV